MACKENNNWCAFGLSIFTRSLQHNSYRFKTLKYNDKTWAWIIKIVNWKYKEIQSKAYKYEIFKEYSDIQKSQSQKEKLKKEIEKETEEIRRFEEKVRLIRINGIKIITFTTNWIICRYIK